MKSSKFLVFSIPHQEKIQRFLFNLSNLVHLHASFANSKFQTFSGHLIDAEISGTSEILFLPFVKKFLKRLIKKQV